MKQLDASTEVQDIRRRFPLPLTGLRETRTPSNLWGVARLMRDKNIQSNTNDVLIRRMRISSERIKKRECHATLPLRCGTRDTAELLMLTAGNSYKAI